MSPPVRHQPGGWTFLHLRPRGIGASRDTSALALGSVDLQRYSDSGPREYSAPMTSNLDARLASYSSPVLSIFRIVFGLLYTLHGAMKVFGWPLGEAAPGGTWPYWFAGIIELVLGILITVGFSTRIAAFIASGEMAVAYFWQHWGILGGTPASFWPFDAQMGGNGGELAILYCFAFLLLATTGAGAWSVDGRRRVGAGYAGTSTGYTRGTTAAAVPRRRGLAGLRDRFSRRV